MKNLAIFFFIGLALSVIFQSPFPLVVFFLLIPILLKKAFDQNEGSMEDFLKKTFAEKFNEQRAKKGARKFVENNLENNTINFPKMDFSFKKIAGLIGALAILLVVLDGFVNVPAGHAAVIYDRGRGVLETPLGEGIHLKIPFWQKATVITTRIQAYTMSSAVGEGEKYQSDAIEALTKDGQKVKLDLTVQFYLQKENTPGVYQQIGLDYIEKIVRPGARSISREVVTSYNSKELFQNETRIRVQNEVIEKMTTYLSDKKIKLEGVLIRNIKFSDIYLSAIEEKQVAEQKIQKAEFEKQEAEIRKEKTIIEAEAEAEAIKLKGEALSKNQEIIQLEMVNKLSPNINWGVLPDGVMPLLDLKAVK